MGFDMARINATYYPWKCTGNNIKHIRCEYNSIGFGIITVCMCVLPASPVKLNTDSRKVLWSWEFDDTWHVIY